MATRYIRTGAGASDANDGLSWANAWLTLQKAETSATAGDTIIAKTELDVDGVPVCFTGVLSLTKAFNWVFDFCILDLENTLTTPAVSFPNTTTIRGSLNIINAKGAGAVTTGAVNFSGTGSTISGVAVTDSPLAAVNPIVGSGTLENILIDTPFPATNGVALAFITSASTLRNFTFRSKTSGTLLYPWNAGNTDIFDSVFVNGTLAIYAFNSTIRNAKRLAFHNCAGRLTLDGTSTIPNAAENDDRDGTNGWGADPEYNPQFADADNGNYTITNASLLPLGARSGRRGATDASKYPTFEAPRGAYGMWMTKTGSFINASGDEILAASGWSGVGNVAEFNDARGMGWETTGASGTVERTFNLGSGGKLISLGITGYEEVNQGDGLNGVIDFDNASSKRDVELDTGAGYATHVVGTLINVVPNVDAVAGRFKVRVTLRRDGTD